MAFDELYIPGTLYPEDEEGKAKYTIDELNKISKYTSAISEYISAIGPGAGEANTSSNVGSGQGLALPKVGVNLPFKSLVAGTNITLTPGTDTLTISATGDGSGGQVDSVIGGDFITVDSTDPVNPIVHWDNANLGDLLNVDTVTNQLLEGQGLYYDADTSSWKNRSGIAEAMPTGLINGGELNISATPTNIEVLAGTGIIVDSYTNPGLPAVAKILTWDIIDQPITAAPAQAGSVVFFSMADSGVPATPPEVGGIPSFVGELKQYAVQPTPDLAREEIFLGIAIHNGDEWNEVSNPKVINQLAETFREYLVYVADFSSIISGGTVSEQPNFQLEQEAGIIWEQNRNWHVDKTDPNREAFPGASPMLFRYVTRDFGNTEAATPTIDPTRYDNGTGAPVTVPGSANVATIQKVYLDLADNYWVLWGQEVYETYDVAVANLAADYAASTIPPLLAGSILLGFVVAEKGRTDWGPGEASFIPAALGGAGGGGGAAGVEQIVAGTNITIDPPSGTGIVTINATDSENFWAGQDDDIYNTNPGAVVIGPYLTSAFRFSIRESTAENTVLKLEHTLDANRPDMYFRSVGTGDKSIGAIWFSTGANDAGEARVAGIFTRQYLGSTWHGGDMVFYSRDVDDPTINISAVLTQKGEWFIGTQATQAGQTVRLSVQAPSNYVGAEIYRQTVTADDALLQFWSDHNSVRRNVSAVRADGSYAQYFGDGVDEFNYTAEIQANQFRIGQLEVTIGVLEAQIAILQQQVTDLQNQIP